MVHAGLTLPDGNYNSPIMGAQQERNRVNARGTKHKLHLYFPTNCDIERATAQHTRTNMQRELRVSSRCIHQYLRLTQCTAAFGDQIVIKPHKTERLEQMIELTHWLKGCWLG